MAHGLEKLLLITALAGVSCDQSSSSSSSSPQPISMTTLRPHDSPGGYTIDLGIQGRQEPLHGWNYTWDRINTSSSGIQNYTTNGACVEIMWSENPLSADRQKSLYQADQETQIAIDNQQILGYSFDSENLQGLVLNTEQNDIHYVISGIWTEPELETNVRNFIERIYFD